MNDKHRELWVTLLGGAVAIAAALVVLSAIAGNPATFLRFM